MFALWHEARFLLDKIPQSGANEFSAMAAAEGEVQEKQYVASFPSLVRFGDEMAYLMVLKDAAGLVKMYAAVGVDQYNIVAATSVQNDTVARFRQMLSGTPVTDLGTAAAPPATSATANQSGPALARQAFFAVTTSHTTLDVVVRNYDLVTIDGNTYVYLHAIVRDGGADLVLFSLYTDVTEIVALDVSGGVNSRAATIETDGTYFVFKD